MRRLFLCPSASASAVALLTAAGLLGGCGGAAPPERAAEGPLVVYSGRNEALIGPLLERFEEQEGIAVEARYGETAELAATLLEEGEHSPADVFLSQDAAALGALSAAGRLAPLPAELLDRVPAGFRSPRGDWVGLSGRARTVVYNTERLTPAELPASLEAVTDPRFRGRFGVAPTNGSFQAHMAVYRVLRGRPALDRLLAGMAANQPLRYPKNSAIVEAVIAGEIDWGLVNHYYLWRALAERPGAPAANYFMSEGAAAGFVNLAGAGLVRDRPAGRRLLAHLLAADGQRYFAEQTFEYPVVPEVPAAPGLPPLPPAAAAEVDFAAVSSALEETLVAIHDSGLVE